jgi:hypothetical protein
LVTHFTPVNPERRDLARDYDAMNDASELRPILEMLSAPWQEGALEPFTVRCDARSSDGVPCGADAIVLTIDYVAEPGAGVSSEKQTHFDIECPRCGKRTQIEA